MDLHGILIVDKPRGMTSHDVVGRIRRLLKTRKVGHAGTLDPAAEGVLVVAIGRATRLLSFLSDSSKQYAAHIVLGVGSTSGDVEGPAEPTSEVPPPGHGDVTQALAELIGDVDQRPPALSAIKLRGQPIYRRVRRGEDVDVPPRRVTIHTLNVIDYQYPDLFLEIECSAGTYVRALARDIGQALGTSAYLHYLLRVRSGSFDLGDAWPMKELERHLNPNAFPLFAKHPASGTEGADASLLGADSITAWYDGRPVIARLRDENASIVHAFRDDGTWLGTGVRAPDREAYQPRIVVHE